MKNKQMLAIQVMLANWGNLLGRAGVARGKDVLYVRKAPSHWIQHRKEAAAEKMAAAEAKRARKGGILRRNFKHYEMHQAFLKTGGLKNADA